MGAWIEIILATNDDTCDTVAPLVGAWIEIRPLHETVQTGSVAPLVGAWIEICGRVLLTHWTLSLLSWERGLKLYNSVLNIFVPCVAPLVGAWIEIIKAKTVKKAFTMSLLSWERGLK